MRIERGYPPRNQIRSTSPHMQRCPPAQSTSSYPRPARSPSSRRSARAPVGLIAMSMANSTARTASVAAAHVPFFHTTLFASQAPCPVRGYAINDAITRIAGSVSWIGARGNARVRTIRARYLRNRKHGRLRAGNHNSVVRTPTLSRRVCAALSHGVHGARRHARR